MVFQRPIPVRSPFASATSARFFRQHPHDPVGFGRFGFPGIMPDGRDRAAVLAASLMMITARSLASSSAIPQRGALLASSEP
jgi:hypothetical protein